MYSFMSQQMLDNNNISISKINTYLDQHFVNSERNPTSFSGRTSHYNDSDSEEFSSAKGLNLSLDDQQILKEYSTFGTNIPAYTNLYHQVPEVSHDSRQSQFGLLESIVGRISSPKIHYQAKLSPVMENALVRDCTDFSIMCRI